MRIRIAAIGVSHWHSLYDSAYLRHAFDMPDVELVGVHDPDPEIAAKRAAALGNPPVFTDYREMLARTRPDFVIALGRHRTMAETAHHLLDERYPFLMEKPMGVSAAEVRSVADKAAATNAFVAVPLGQRYLPSVVARPAADRRGAPRPTLALLLPAEPADLRALLRLGFAVDARSRRGGRRLSQEPRPARARSLPDSHRRGRAGDRGAAELAGARAAGGGLRVGAAAHVRRRPRDDRGRQHVSAQRHRRGMEDRRPRRHLPASPTVRRA